MTGPKHIRTRLALWYSALLGSILLISLGGAIYFFLHGLRGEFDRNLTEHYERAARHLEAEPHGALHLRKPERTADNPNRDFADEMLIEAWSPQGEVLYQSNAWKKSGFTGAPPKRSDSGNIYSVKSETGQRLRLRTGTVTVPRDLILRVALDEDRVWHEVRELGTAILFFFPLALIMAGAAGYWMAAKALRPVEKMSKRAESISAESLHERLPIGNPDDELGSLAKIINGLLHRLEKSFVELRRFTSDASHELRTPLQAIRSLGEVALQQKQDADYYRNVISSILEENDRMSRLTHNLLALSRADSGNFKLNRTPTCLFTLVEQSKSLLEVLAEEKKQTLTLTARQKPTLSVDPIVLRQAVINLVDNAIKYSPDGAQIDAEVFTNADNIVIQVSDNGPGISESDFTKIFDRFYRVDKSRSRDLGGAGLGLSIAKWAVEAHGGTIEIDSQMGRGSTFRIVLS